MHRFDAMAEVMLLARFLKVALATHPPPPQPNLHNMPRFLAQGLPIKNLRPATSQNFY